MPSPLPSQARLLDMLAYDPTTGQLVWKVIRGGPAQAGSAAGSINQNGYVYIKVDGSQYKVHRIIWKMVTGADPKNEIDHIDLNKANNAWGNLREALPSQNCGNCPGKPRKNGLPKGVSIGNCKKRYKARIQVRGKHYHLGVFDTPAQAHEAYMAAARDKFGAFARAA